MINHVYPQFSRISAFWQIFESLPENIQKEIEVTIFKIYSLRLSNLIQQECSENQIKDIERILTDPVYKIEDIASYLTSKTEISPDRIYELLDSVLQDIVKKMHL